MELIIRKTPHVKVDGLIPSAKEIQKQAALKEA
jgi:hypothetical protein